MEIGNINIQMQDLSGRRNTNDMDIEPSDSSTKKQSDKQTKDVDDTLASTQLSRPASAQ